MRKLLLLALVSGVTLGACADPNYRPDPDVAVCNVGGPLGKLERSLATAPKPGAVQGRPLDCQMDARGVMRRTRTN